jgi:hypothetical protein
MFWKLTISPKGRNASLTCVNVIWSESNSESPLSSFPEGSSYPAIPKTCMKPFVSASSRFQCFGFDPKLPSTEVRFYSVKVDCYGNYSDGQEEIFLLVDESERTLAWSHLIREAIVSFPVNPIRCFRLKVVPGDARAFKTGSGCKLGQAWMPDPASKGWCTKRRNLGAV